MDTVKNKWPSFDDSMQNSNQYLHNKSQNEYWDLIVENYENIKNREMGKQKIPKILHQIWLGGDMPERENHRCDDVKNSLPNDWEYKLWTEDNIHEIEDFVALEYYEQTPSYGQKSDIYRNEILYQFGGVYLDTDFIVYKSFDQFLDLDYVAGVAYDGWPSIMNSCVCSSPKNKIVESMRIYDKKPNWSDPMSVIDTTGPYHSYRKLMPCLNDQNLLILPNSFFYPFPNDLRKQNIHEQFLKEETVCCHLWSCTWMS